jgi:hypothetical protein
LGEGAKGQKKLLRAKVTQKLFAIKKILSFRTLINTFLENKTFDLYTPTCN